MALPPHFEPWVARLSEAIESKDMKVLAALPENAQEWLGKVRDNADPGSLKLPAAYAALDRVLFAVDDMILPLTQETDDIEGRDREFERRRGQAREALAELIPLFAEIGPSKRA